MKLLQVKGLDHIVLCPGSRSSPLAIAAGKLEQLGNLKLITSLDERSGAFLALGISASLGKAVGVITTSGTAVANLLPATVEADRSCHPLLLITADRPLRLKNCGSNQTVNQEEFLISAVRSVEQGPVNGVHGFGSRELGKFVSGIWQKAHAFPGPVHVNFPLEEPLHPNVFEQEEVWSGWFPESFEKSSITLREDEESVYQDERRSFEGLDPSYPGVVVAGPWRGSVEGLSLFKKAFQEFQMIFRWPIFSDPLSGISSDLHSCIANWELILDSDLFVEPEHFQILRLGPMPSSRSLENWLKSLRGKHLLITEGDSRRLDPLGIASQWSDGFVDWWERNQSCFDFSQTKSCESCEDFLEKLLNIDSLSKDWLDRKLHFSGSINEPALARWLPCLLPKNLQLMLAASSPIRDFLSFSGIEGSCRHCFAFRGASGIDGTLSIAMGIAYGNGPTVLLTGDMALLHDNNGWLIARPKGPPLVVVLIDNAGGGIFEQVQLEMEQRQDFEKLFAMPQAVDYFSLAAAYQIPFRQVTCFEDLQPALEWGLAHLGPVLIRVCTNRKEDAQLRKEVREELANYLQQKLQNGLSNC